MTPLHAHLRHREIRFAENGIVQAISTDLVTPLFNGMRAIEPPGLEDDAAWVVESGGDPDGKCYVLTSEFAVTHGPYDWQQRFDNILAPYGLGIEPRKLYTRGEAYFSDLETHCFADAVHRLSWLESFFIVVNRSVEERCLIAWDWLAEQVTAHLSANEVSEQEIIDPPSVFELMAPKSLRRRTPGQRASVPMIES
ncbi:MAG: hypothetical protein ACYC96_02180 [Fimbriimonadaceae bacterium]